MTKTKTIIIVCLAILIAIFSGCSTKENNSEPELQTSATVAVTDETTTEQKQESETTTEKKSNSESKASASETTAKKNSNSDKTTKAAEQKTAARTTTKKVTTTQKQTTTEKQTTTKKVTTTQKPTTTKKVTTTEDDWDCNIDGHSCKVGPIGWVNSYDEAAEKARKYIDKNADSGGYRVECCYWCGKYTASITLD